MCADTIHVPGYSREDVVTLRGAAWWIVGFEDGGDLVRLARVRDGAERVVETALLPNEN